VELVSDSQGEIVPSIHNVSGKMLKTVLCRLIFLGVLVSLLSACQVLPVDKQSSAGRDSQPAGSEVMVMDTHNPLMLESIVPTLAKKKVVFVGETHDRYEHHLNQLAVIKAMYASHPDMAIGLEFFQVSTQPFLDDYIAGKIDDQAFLEKTEYYDRWQYDFRLYQPILVYAREMKIPLVALNLPTEITKKVGKQGISALSQEEKRLLPKSIDREVPGYRQRIKSVFSGHPGMEKRNIDDFIEAQLLWDEGMAEQAAKYLDKNPSRKMVILAGAGHIMYGSGIPVRLQRRIKADFATVLTNGNINVDSKVADYILFTKEKNLPKSGLIGVLLEPAKQGVKIGDFSPEGAAKKAGLKKDDRIISVEGRAVKKISDIRLMLWNKKPGEEVSVTVMRDGSGNAAKKHEFQVVLK
jgi:uncharacterized iron-regulated protein